MNNVVNVRPISKTCRRKFGKDKKWFLLFKKNFNIKKIEKVIQCEGFKVLILLNKLGKIEDSNLIIFIENGNLGKFISSRDKEEYLKNYLKKRDKTFSLKRNNSFNTIGWLKTIQKKDNNKRGLKNSKINIINRLENYKSRYKRKVWISVGINNYKFWPKLQNAEKDASKIADFAQDNHFYSEKFINSSATKDNIEKLFKDQLYRQLDSDDLLVFSFHGHGTNIIIDNKNHGFIVPFDANINPSPYELISMEEFTSWIRFLKCRHVLLLFDCCFSGFAVLRGAIPKTVILEEKEQKFRLPEKTYEKNNGKMRRFSNFTIQKILSQKNRIAITAGSSDQMVSDGGWEDNSAFTGLIISYPGFKTGIGSIMELYTYLLINVPKYSNQTPCIGKLIGDEGGDIFLSL